MKNKFTPGPWSVCHDHGWLVVESKNNDLYLKIGKGHAAQKHMADARLIAAAPELLAALQDAYPFVHDETLRHRIGAVIIKAMGETA